MIEVEKHTLPLVSVCIPTYNAENSIVNTLNSVINQTYQHLEIIVCDNQSTDNTVELVRTIEDDRIQLSVNSENFGMVGNFNIVLSKANGVFVKLLCADDVIETDCIEKQVNVFLDNPNSNIVMVTAEKFVISSKGKCLFIKRFPGKAGIYQGENVIRKSFRYGTNIFGEPGVALFLNDAIRKAGPIDIPLALTYVVDLQLYAQVLKHGNLFVIKEPLFSFRVSSTSFTASSKWNPPKVFNRLRKKYTKENFIHFTFIDKILSFVMAWILSVVRNLIFKFSSKK
ncbi:MAG TPA: glycosyltransferase family 2 protein [Bacteroidales bacterium]|nr:glycosyltransferase family 2 protein [Bacteroidales bacterium]HQB75063.1 glycosyltransferase family 2 protein [Bacteroidales bacterium]